MTREPIGREHELSTPLPTWAEAEIIAQPVRQASKPRVLVRRRRSGLVSPDRAELIYFERRPVISLFTGCGGLDVGLEQAGFITVVQHEWWGAACETLIANRPSFFRHAALIQGDVHLTPTSLILREGGLRVGEAEIVAGGPPCQGFSVAGKRDPADVRNTLVFEFLRVVREAQPRFFIFENVPGFQTLVQGQFLGEFLKSAYESYYELVYGLLDCAGYRVPQHRVRFICMGTRRDLAEIEGILASLPKPQCFGPGTLEKSQQAEKWLLISGPHLEALAHAPGVRYFPDRPVLVTPAPVADTSGERSQTFIEFYARLEREEPDRIVRRPVQESSRSYFV